jgi:hypothetical protein
MDFGLMVIFLYAVVFVAGAIAFSVLYYLDPVFRGLFLNFVFKKRYFELGIVEGDHVNPFIIQFGEIFEYNNGQCVDWWVFEPEREYKLAGPEWAKTSEDGFKFPFVSDIKESGMPKNISKKDWIYTRGLPLLLVSSKDLRPLHIEAEGEIRTRSTNIATTLISWMSNQSKKNALYQNIVQGGLLLCILGVIGLAVLILNVGGLCNDMNTRIGVLDGKLDSILQKLANAEVIVQPINKGVK